MTLTNIAYGSIASSQVLNNNFSYLDDRITEINQSITSSISTILSNIATINSNFSELSDSVTDSIQSLSSSLAEHKTKTRITINNSSMTPNWTGLIAVNVSEYTAPANGFILAITNSSASGNMTVNNITVPLKYCSTAYDYAAELISVPVKKGDVISCSLSFRSVYFLPAVEFSMQDEDDSE